MNLTKAAYFLSTALVVLPMTGSATMYFTTAELNMLGLPEYFWSILGTWKLLGVLALAVPGLALLKEWAYAGFFFTLTGAVASHLLFGEGLGHAAPPVFFIVLLAVSYLTRPETRRVDAAPFLTLPTVGAASTVAA